MVIIWGATFCCCDWYDCYAVMAYIVSSQFFIGDKCTAPCCEEDFSWQKNYGTYSTVFPAIFLSFFFMEVKCKSNNFYWRCIDWIEWNVKLFMFHDEADGQTHVHYHCVVVVVLWILATAHNAHSNQEAHEAAMSADAYNDTIHLCNWTRLSINKERCMPVANQMVVFWLSWWSHIAIDSRTSFWWWSDLASSAIDFLPHFSFYWTSRC